jgi:hypothetical protein
VQRLEPIQIRDRRQHLPKALRNGTKADFQHLKKSLSAGKNFPLIKAFLASFHTAFHTAFLMALLAALLTKTVCECHGELG